MERLRTLTTIAWMIAGLLALELVMLTVILWPGNFFLWANLGIVAILCIFLVRLSLTLLSERKKQEPEKG